MGVAVQVAVGVAVDNAVGEAVGEAVGRDGQVGSSFDCPFSHGYGDNLVRGAVG